MKHTDIRLSTGVLALVLAGCWNDSKPRTYTEVAFHELPQAPAQGPAGMGMGAGMPPMMNASPVDIKVTWKLPQGWIQKDSALGMRVGSFLAQDSALAGTGEVDPQAVDISVIQLAGDAGGLKPNITRWMGQIGLISTPETLDALIKGAAKFKTKSGQEGMYVDLTDKLSGDMTQSKTILGAFINTADYTVFIKSMGEREKVIANKKKFRAFCESISIAKGLEA